jgi:hypothetical protein
VRSGIVVSGALAQRPGVGGHTWVFLQYLLGFERLGWDVLFIDRLEPEMCVDEGGEPCALEDSVNIRYLHEVMHRFGLGDSYGLLYDGGSRTVGLSRREMEERTRRSALLLNVMGFLDDEAILAAAPKRVFLDIDPGFGQMWQDLGYADLFHGHDAYVTVGENLGRADCSIPTCGIDWVTTPQPVLLAHWPETGGGESGTFTSIGAWRGPYAPVEYRGATYGLRAHEFRRFMDLPGRSGASFQVALDIHSAEEPDLARLRDGGWTLIDPRAVARDPASYQAFIRGSKAELMVAKGMYVHTNSGWFSDRSICYLASGRPVLAQETGFSGRYPTGEGLLSFSTVEEALGGVAEIESDYARHARAARRIAAEHFDSDRVLTRLLARLDCS